MRTVVNRPEFPIDQPVLNSIKDRALAISGPHAAASPWAPYNTSGYGNPLDNLQNSLDIIGTFDPTPIVDTVNAIISVIRGRYGAAATSMVAAVIPYAGDAAKATKIGKTIIEKAVHGNSILSKKIAYLYKLVDEEGHLLKWGVTQDMEKRYSKAFMEGKEMKKISGGSRAEILPIERTLIEINPGPLNREPWAGAEKGRSMMIGAGGVYNGPELEGSLIERFLRATYKAIKTSRGQWKEGDAPAVIVVWVVPGSLGEVNFTGQRITLFSKKKRLLQIEAAVPKEVVEAGGSVEFVIDALQKAIKTAADVFSCKGPEPFDLAKAETIVEKVKGALENLGSVNPSGP